MTKKEYIQAIIDGVKEIWEVEELADSPRSRYIWAAKLMDMYSDEDIIGGAEWIMKWKKPRTIAELYFAMPRFIAEKEAEEKKKRWQFV
ncbi:MAG: hypothetical protein IPM48_14410 [Saprospiraceae bacterium]|nr:hypothetical protein [Saprospiraceae bacterium]